MVISNSADAFRIQYNMLVLSGMWPKENPNVVYRIRTLLSWFSVFGIYTILLIEFIHDIDDFMKLPETLYILVTYMGLIVKLLVFTHRKKELLNIVNFLKDPIFTSYPEDLDHCLEKSIKQSVFVARFFCTWAAGLTLGYFIYPILDHKPLPFPFPYNLGKHTLIMYAFQIIGHSLSAMNNISFDLMCVSLMKLAVGQMDILIGKITDLEQDDSELEDLSILNEVNESITEKLKNCVKHHLAIISLVNSIEHVFTIAVFGQFVTSAIVICNTLFDFVLIPLSSKMFMLGDYIVCILFQLFIYCWFGNEIIFKSLQIGEACYMSKWYTLDKKACKYLFIIMERAKRPLRITTMKIFELSLSAFASILQWSYSYLTLLLKFYYKQS